MRAGGARRASGGGRRREKKNEKKNAAERVPSFTDMERDWRRMSAGSSSKRRPLPRSAAAASSSVLERALVAQSSGLSLRSITKPSPAPLAPDDDVFQNESRRVKRFEPFFSAWLVGHRSYE